MKHKEPVIQEALALYHNYFYILSAFLNDKFLLLHQLKRLQAIHSFQRTETSLLLLDQNAKPNFEDELSMTRR